MSERRPHWDDDLIDSVVHAISDNYDYEYRAYAVIAAVEDWHEQKGEDNLPLLVALMNAEATKLVRRAEKAEAAIQRVREVCDEPISPEWRGAYNDLAPHAWSAGYIAAIRSVRRALDGETPNKGDQ